MELLRHNLNIHECDAGRKKRWVKVKERETETGREKVGEGERENQFP